MRGRYIVWRSFLQFGMCVLAVAKAHAYGPDGLFGGRQSPDGSITVAMPVQTEPAPERAASVLDHPRPDYDPTPLQWDGLSVEPSLTGSVSHDSNIFSAARGTPDTIFTADPVVQATSNWGRHFVSAIAGGDLNFYRDNGAQDFNAALLQLNGRYDVAEQSWLALRGGYQLQPTPKAALNNSAGSSQTVFNLYSAGATAFRGVGLIQAQLDYDFDHYDYIRSPTTVDPADFFNHSENRLGARVYYAGSESFKPYLKAQFDSRIYDLDQARSSRGAQTDLGVMWDYGGIAALDIYCGYLYQNYASFGRAPLNDGIDFGGKLTWNVTGLTTVALESGRSIQDAQIDAYNSYLASGGSATVTHELRRNLLLEADAAYTNDAYRGLTRRADDIYSLGGGGRYLINQHLHADLDYTWSRRASSDPDQGYVDHLVIGKIGLQL